jgi:hypothetical protein
MKPKQFKDGLIVPSVSKKQHNFMAAVAKNPSFAKKVGVPAKVGQEFLTADKGKKFGSGGTMKKKMRKFADGGETGFEPKSGALKMLEYMRSEPKSDLDQLRSNIKSTGRGLASAAKSAAGATPMAAGMRMGLRGVENMAKDMPKSYDEEKSMKKGGKVHSDIAKDKPMMKKVAAAAVKGHEKKMHGMAKGGVTRADGCVMKGHTKGKMVKMAGGGSC